MEDLEKIKNAIEQARQTLSEFTPGRIASELKAGGDPVTAADVELDKVLRKCLCNGDEGWLSEETVDDFSRLDKTRVWIVDPLDGTREFIEGIDEWCVSIALVENGRAVAAGIFNAARDQVFLGSRQTGVTLNGQSVTVSDRSCLEQATVLASRSEVRRGEWKRFENAPFTVIPCGSVAYKLAQVSAQLSDATFTLVPKNEWDVAAGSLLIEAAGGRVIDSHGRDLVFNRKDTLLPGIIACGQVLFDPICEFLEIDLKDTLLSGN